MEAAHDGAGGSSEGDRVLLAFNKSFTCTYLKIGDTELFYKAQSRKSARRRRGPALISDVGDTGATAKFQSQISKVARFCVRKEGGEKDVEDAELDPAQTRYRQFRADLGFGEGYVRGQGGWEGYQSTGTPKIGPGHRAEMSLVPDSPAASAQLPSPRDAAGGRQHLELSFEKKCTPSQAPRAGGTQYDELTWGQLHGQCSQRGSRKTESKAALKTRLSTMGATERKLDVMAVTQEDGKRTRVPVKGAEASDNPTQPTDLAGKRGRAPAMGVKDSDFPTQLLDSTRGGGNEDILGSGPAFLGRRYRKTS